MDRKKLFLIISILLAVGAALTIMAYLGQERKRILADAQKKLETIAETQTAVLVATKDIPKGSTIESGSLAVKILPKQFIQPGAVTSADRIAGMVTIAPIVKDEQITLSKLTSGRKAQADSLAMATPVGKRAITISVDNIASLSGMIKPGDYVDLIATIPVPVQMPDGKQATQPATTPLFQNVLVLAVGRETSSVSPADEGRYKKEEKKDSSAGIITLALAPQDANLLAFVQEQSKIRLVLRSPADSQVQQVPPASWDTLFQYLMPPELAAQIAEKKEAPKKQVKYIEIYRGLNKENIPLNE